MTVPVLSDSDALKEHINGQIRRIYEASGRPADFSFDVETVEPAEGDPWTAEFIVKAGAATFAARLAIVGCVEIEGPKH